MSKQKVEIMEGPFGAALVEDTEGVIYREIKTVRVENGMLTEYITSHTRHFGQSEARILLCSIIRFLDYMFTLYSMIRLCSYQDKCRRHLPPSACNSDFDKGPHHLV